MGLGRWVEHRKPAAAATVKVFCGMNGVKVAVVTETDVPLEDWQGPVGLGRCGLATPTGKAPTIESFDLEHVGTEISPSP